MGVISEIFLFHIKFQNYSNLWHLEHSKCQCYLNGSNLVDQDSGKLTLVLEKVSRMSWIDYDRWNAMGT